MGPLDATQQPTDPSQIQQQLQGVAQQAQSNMQPVPQVGPDQGSPVRRFLTNFFYGMGQGALAHAGLPTDYQKQQQTIANNQRQQQLSQQAAETASLVGLHQQQLQNEQQAYSQNAYENEQVPVPQEIAQHFPGQATARRRDINGMLQTGSLLNERMPVTLDDDLAGAVGVPPGTQVPHVLLPVLTKMASLRGQGWQIKEENGHPQRVNKFTGEVQPVLDNSGRQLTSNAMLTPWERAKANAAYRPFQAMDDQGNPTTISAQQALTTGAPSMTEKQTTSLQADRTGIGQFLDNNNFFRQHMGVLDDMTQRGLIARATREAECSPGAAQAIIEGYTQKGMTPEAAEFASRLLNQREVSAIPRKYTGQGGAATDALRNIVNSNLPSAAHSSLLNNALLDRDDRMARGVLQNLQRPSAYAPRARGTVNSTAGGVAPEGFRVKMPDGSTQVKRNGQWVRE